LTQSLSASHRIRRSPSIARSSRLNHIVPPAFGIQVETHARNEALSWIRARGFNHILVVDGDELWRRGTMAALLTQSTTSSTVCLHRDDPDDRGAGYPSTGHGLCHYLCWAGRLVQRVPQHRGDKVQLNGNRVIHFSANPADFSGSRYEVPRVRHYDDATMTLRGDQGHPA